MNGIPGPASELHDSTPPVRQLVEETMPGTELAYIEIFEQGVVIIGRESFHNTTTDSIEISPDFALAKEQLADDNSAQFYKQLDELDALEPDWNGYGSMPPNATAIEHSRVVLECLDDLGHVPSRVVASADDGVGIYITRGARYAVLECMNDGDVVVGTSDRQGNIATRETGSTVPDIRRALEEILAFLDG